MSMEASRNTEKARPCGFWSQDWGRDTHVCKSTQGHDDDHACKCGARWSGPDRKVRRRPLPQMRPQPRILALFRRAFWPAGGEG